MKSSEIRRKFLHFFSLHGHQIVPSASLVPINDPTLLITNAGMNQFKDVFLGIDKRPYCRAVSSQKCVRAGGKHNDLENVGYTARHHTFFEMLGNFSFGDYFKRDAILYAWEFLTSDQWLHLPKEKLWVTVYANDEEAYTLWHKSVGLPAERIIRIGHAPGDLCASDNFWSMGDTGPCGPCTEIFYDHGESIPGGLPGSPEQEGDRYVEIWNNVFMQFNRDKNGEMHPLPQPSVDTGMGLERISAIMQGLHSNYEIDLFQNLIEAIYTLIGNADRSSPSLRVIADHIRSCAFLIADGVFPAHEGRGYVLRRIIRRAVRHGYFLGEKKPFFYKIVAPLSQLMGDVYPELIARQSHIEDTLRQEEILFRHTLEHGLSLLDTMLANDCKILDGAIAFKLADTFGFPIDLTADICRERGVVVDIAGFETALASQRQRSKSADKFHMSSTGLTYDGPASHFHGYTELTLESTVLAIYKDAQAVEQLQQDEIGIIVLDQTLFYAESGGQVGDLGQLYTRHNATSELGQKTLFNVTQTQKIKSDVFGHHGQMLQGCLKVGDTVVAQVDQSERIATARNHSATHLLHATLRKVLGTHVEQRGSLVTGHRLRFDFVHAQALSLEEICLIEQQVNDVIMRNLPVTIHNTSYNQALQSGALALFGEKYGDQVRVVHIEDASTELCGGTHVNRTGDIGFFKIVEESGIASGIRRIEAKTGAAALQQAQAEKREIQTAYSLTQAQPGGLLLKLKHAQEHTKHLEKTITQLRTQRIHYQVNELLAQVVDHHGIQVLTAQLAHEDHVSLRQIISQLNNKLTMAAIVLTTIEQGQVLCMAGVSRDMMSTIKAGDLVNFVAHQIGGKGGGRADIAQAGGTQAEGLPAALASVAEWVSQQWMQASGGPRRDAS